MEPSKVLKRVTLGFPEPIYKFIEDERKLSGISFGACVMELLRDSPAWDRHIKSTTVMKPDEPKPRRLRALTPSQIAKLHLYHGKDLKPDPNHRTWEVMLEQMTFERSQRWIDDDTFTDWALAAKQRRDELYGRAPTEQKPFLSGYDDRCNHGMMYPTEPCYDCDKANGLIP
jgi:hypothetical protein